MSQVKRKSKKSLTRAVAFFLAFAMVVTSLYVSPYSTASAAKVKVSKVAFTKPTTKVLVLKKGKTYKLSSKVTVKPSKAKYKKVTYKSSKKSVATVNAKGLIKAKKNGTTKITVTSKTNKKKKATLTVKVGTPITKVSLNKKSSKLIVGDTLKLKASYNKKATYKAVTWSSTNPIIAKVSKKGVVTAVAGGTVKITAKAADGSGKKAVCNVYVSDKPTEGITIEDFQNSTIGNYLKFTYGGRKLEETGAKMEVVQDPANASNKLLKITIANNSKTNCGYDFAPVVSVDLNKIDATKGTSLEDYTALSLDTRVVSTGDNVYKRLCGYVAPYGALNSSFAFSTYDEIKPENDANTKLIKQFSVKTPMLRNKSTKNADGTYTDVSSDSLNGYMPMNKSADGKPNDEGYSESNHAVPLVQRTLQFYKDNMSFDKEGDGTKETDLTTLSQFDLVLGATYPETKVGESTTWYLDDIKLVKRTGIVPATGITATPSSQKINLGQKGSIVAKLAPEGCTDSLVYSSSDTNIVTVNTAGDLVASATNVGTATITVSAKKNPAVKAICTVEVVKPKAEQVEIPISKANSALNGNTNVTDLAEANTGVTLVFGDTNGDGVVDTQNSSKVVTPKYSAVAFNVPAGKNNLSVYKCIRFTGKVNPSDLLNGGKIYKFTVAAIKYGATNNYQEPEGTKEKTRISEKYIDIDLTKADSEQYKYLTFNSATGEFTADIVFDGDLSNVGSVMIGSNNDDTAGLTLNKITCVPYADDEKDARETYPYLALPYTQDFESSTITSDSFYMAGDLAYTYNDATAALGASGPACITVPKNDYNGPAFLISNYKGTADKSFYVTAKFKAADEASFDKPVYFKGGNNLDKINNANVVWATSYLKDDWGVMSAKITLKPGEFSEVRIMSTSGNFLFDDLAVKEYADTDAIQIDYPDKEPVEDNDTAANVSVDLSKVTGYNSATGAVDLTFASQYAETKIALPSPVQLALYDSVTVSMAATGNIALKYYDEDGNPIGGLVRYGKVADTTTGRDTWAGKVWNGVDVTTKIAAVGIMSNDGACTATISSVFATPSDTIKADLSTVTGYDATAGLAKLTFAAQYGETKVALPVPMRLAVIDSITVKMANAVGTGIALKYYDEDGNQIAGLVRYGKNSDTVTGRDTWAGKVWNGVDINTKVAAVGIMSNDAAGSVDVSSIFVTPSDVLTADLSGVTGYDSTAKVANLTFAAQYGETKIALPAAVALSQLKSVTVKMSNAVGTLIALKYYDEDGNQIGELVRYGKNADTITARDTWAGKVWNNADTTKKVAAVGIMSNDAAGSVTISGVTAEIDR